ncbi:hypothetical protein, conserved [Eimeria tenella]|uniref:AP2/ERF domain-containing protein n=1 Tax=Eimeria tenella TaxID=5802 RepID=U6KTI7_EIMTE|nr:hypothetical protein, conserved [Eimeria tenella]CDJ41407.1 hypothetical protein, conserved [Eimeria tenella]|eukprot:XP_013232157.1 hypothetical protein, conserved [Eimeria tenella]
MGLLQHGGLEGARAKALALLQQLQRQGKLQQNFSSSSSSKPEVCRSGVSGVYYEPEEKLWVAAWQQAGLRCFRAFSVLQLGFAAAFRAAAATRQQQLALNYQFVIKRHRRRAGRQPLK